MAKSTLNLHISLKLLLGLSDHNKTIFKQTAINWGCNRPMSAAQYAFTEVSYNLVFRVFENNYYLK